MTEQIHVQVFKGYVESQSVASLSFYLVTDDKLTGIDLARSLRTLLRTAVEIRNEVTLARNKELMDHLEKSSSSSRGFRVSCGSILTAREYLEDMFNTNVNDLDEWDLFENTGWNLAGPDQIPITRCISLLNMDAFVEDNKSESDDWYASCYIVDISLIGSRNGFQNH